MLLDYNRHGDILKDLPVNYRPPSALGIAIPLSHNIYNADPSKPLLYSKYKVVHRPSFYAFSGNIAPDHVI